MPTPDNFAIGHSLATDWQKGLLQCIQQISPVPANANLGFLYIADSLAEYSNDIVDELRRQTGIKHWVGTVGIGICATNTEYHETPALAVMAGSFPEQAFRMLPNLSSTEEIELTSWNDWLTDSHLAIVHGDPRNNQIAEIIKNLADGLPGGFLVGGLSSSQGEYRQIADQVFEGGLSGVVFNDQVQVATGLTQGCSPISQKREITECDQNIIITIDDRPALDVFKEDIGEILARDLQRVAGYIFVGLPIPGSDTGDYLVRNLIGIDQENKLLAIGDLVHKHQTIQFCRRDGSSAKEDMSRMLTSLKKRLDGTPRGGVFYSCLGRGPHLFGEDSAEVRAIHQELGDFPLVGFYANGEISLDHLYGYTGVLTLFL